MRMTALLRDERGSITVFAAIAIVTVFLGMTALTFDIGQLLNTRRRMVAAADAAALAAAQSCALREGQAAAAASADGHAGQNQPGAGEAVLMNLSPDCDATSGTAEAGYSYEAGLDIAPLIGGTELQTVSTRAVALWGIAMGSANIVPIELSLAGDDQMNCVVDENADPEECDFADNEDELNCVVADEATSNEEEEEECGSWSSNREHEQFENMSQWGTMDLGQWGVAAEDQCPGTANQNDLKQWLADGGMTLELNGLPTYVCAGSGFGKNFWMNELVQYVGKVLAFPVNRPESMVTTPGREKYAIVGFISMRLKEVVDGKESRAYDRTETCRLREDLNPGDQIDLSLEALLCAGGVAPDEILLPETLDVFKGGRTFTDPGDYSYAGSVLTWNGDQTDGVRIEFDYFISGQCGEPPDPSSNAICLVLEYPGRRLSGFRPDPTGDMDCAVCDPAIQLIE